MPPPCSHLPADLTPAIAARGCETCLEAGRRDWVHLRFCLTCGRVGCCDQSPGKHATAHAATTKHPVTRSFEPDEDWFWCYAGDELFELPGAPRAPSFTD